MVKSIFSFFSAGGRSSLTVVGDDMVAGIGGGDERFTSKVEGIDVPGMDWVGGFFKPFLEGGGGASSDKP